MYDAPFGGVAAVDPELPVVPVEETEPEVLPPYAPAWRAARSVRPRLPRPRPRALLPSAPALFPWLARRLAPGEATLWVGETSILNGLLEWTYAGSAVSGGRVSLLEGANRFHPYRVGEKARALGVDPGEALERIRLARAFTAYQLVALVDAWSKEAMRRHPTLLVAHDLSTMFYVDDVPETERGPLLSHVARTLRELVRHIDAPLVVTETAGFARFPGLKDEGPPLFDLLRATPREGALVLTSLRADEKLHLVPRAPLQRGLEEYQSTGSTEEVIAWDGPFRRTARRSRSG